MIWWIQYILWFGVGLFNGWLDRSALNRFEKDYWNKGKGWIYKWKLDEKGKRIPQTRKLWYYLWYFTPQYKAKFAYASTMLVFLTDGWHLLQFIQFKLAVASTIIGHRPLETTWEGILQLVLIGISFGAGFWISYENPERKTKTNN